MRAREKYMQKSKAQKLNYICFEEPSTEDHPNKRNYQQISEFIDIDNFRANDLKMT